MLKNFVVL